MGLFTAGWEKHYPGMIEWIAPDTGLKSINAQTMEFETDLDTFKADAACVVPGQSAGAIAQSAGVQTVIGHHYSCNNASKADPIYVLGDASVLRRCQVGFSANSQAKVAANAIRGELTGSRVFKPRFANTCWSLVATNDGIKVGANYKAGPEKIDVVDKFISQGGESADVRKATYEN